MFCLDCSETREELFNVPPTHTPRHRAFTAQTTVRPGRHLGTGPALWMNLQMQFDVSVVETTKGDAIDRDLAGAIPA